MSITLSQAEKTIAAAKQKATAIDTKMNIAIVDAGANLVAFARMDRAHLIYQLKRQKLPDILI